MPYVESFDGTNIYYEMKGEGTPLVLLPSCGVTLDVWKFQDPLASKYKLVKIDVAGIGKSERTRKNLTYPSLGEDVKAVIEKEQLENIVILGLGMGGAIALEAAILLKEKMLGIISVDSLLPGTIYYGKKATEKEIAEVMELYKGNYQDYYDNLLRDMLGDRVSPEIVDWFVDIAGYERNDPAILREIVRIMLPHDYHEIIDQVTCPIKYLLRGGFRTVDYVLKEQDDARFIDNVGHNSNIEDPETFNRIVDELIQELVEKK